MLGYFPLMKGRAKVWIFFFPWTTECKIQIFLFSFYESPKDRLKFFLPFLRAAKRMVSLVSFSFLFPFPFINSRKSSLFSILPNKRKICVFAFPFVQKDKRKLSSCTVERKIQTLPFNEQPREESETFLKVIILRMAKMSVHIFP